MAGFVVKQVLGSKLTEMKGGLDKLTGDNASDARTETGEDPEVVQARLEAEERRQEKHRKMEQEREKMRKEIRDKYKIQKKEAAPMPAMDCSGRIGTSQHKTAEEMAREAEEDDSILSQFNGLFDKAKTAVADMANTVKNYLPFNK
uniref:Putative complexin-1 n=1 Tax=Trichuris muris TaxID=70415 RepID=A0A5S6QRK3_TRIMR